MHDREQYGQASNTAWLDYNTANWCQGVCLRLACRAKQERMISQQASQERGRASSQLEESEWPSRTRKNREQRETYKCNKKRSQRPFLLTIVILNTFTLFHDWQSCHNLYVSTNSWVNRSECKWTTWPTNAIVASPNNIIDVATNCNIWLLYEWPCTSFDGSTGCYYKFVASNCSWNGSGNSKKISFTMCA
jgi:hypothetical protein